MGSEPPGGPCGPSRAGRRPGAGPSSGLAPAHPCPEPGVEFSSRRSRAGSEQTPDMPLGLRVRTCLAHVLAFQAFSLRHFANRQ